jgi:hypothetical protein
VLYCSVFGGVRRSAFPFRSREFLIGRYPVSSVSHGLRVAEVIGPLLLFASFFSHVSLSNTCIELMYGVGRIEGWV